MLATVQSRGDRLTVLLVDDEPIIRDAVVAFLRARGAHVVAASSAIEALDVLKMLDVDVLVSDIVMPRESGLWLIREVRSRSTLRSIPAIAFTSVEPDHRQRLLGAGFSAYVPKANPHMLWVTIQTLTTRAA